MNDHSVNNMTGVALDENDDDFELPAGVHVSDELVDAFAAKINEVGIPTIFLDLDGVLADFDAHFLALHGKPTEAFSDDELWELINANETFFADLPLMPGAVEFVEELAKCGIYPIILTACPKTNYQRAARQKRDWVRKHISKDIIILPMLGGRNKSLFLQHPGDILIDDFKKNIAAWNEGGGIGILHKQNFDETLANLCDEIVKAVIKI